MAAEADRAAGHGQRADVLVVMPTYDESAMLPQTVARLRRAVPGADVLVVDDHSPDGTGEVANRLAARDQAVHVLHRAGKLGLGTAYVDGFTWGLARGYRVLVEMDADGSHQAEELPSLLSALRGTEGRPADLVIGSRWVPGGRVENWPRRRELLSRAGNAFTRLALGVPLRDSTAGFRAYRSALLADIDLSRVASQGYCFQVDMAWRAVRAGGTVREVPITFVERTEGRSKMTRQIVLEAFWRVCTWGLAHRVRQVRDATTAVTGRRRPS